MENLSVMDKKTHSRANVLSSKNSQEPNKIDFNGRKNSQQYPRKREYEKFDNGKRPPSNRGGRQGQRNVRPREKMGCQVDDIAGSKDDAEFGSLQKFGSKKQNITHLLNWWGPGPMDQRSRNNAGSSYGPIKRNRKTSFHLKYNKEHFLQANCQFVVSAGEDYSSCKSDPDHLVDWKFVEEVRLHVTEPPSCPICLFPPTAAKITRCGHIYCFPCILHYLALSDQKWRKCPICFEAIHRDDLKSVVAMAHKDFSVGEEIEFQLMRRERDSLIPCPVSCYDGTKAIEIATYSTPLHIQPFSKLIVATQKEATNFILERENKDLLSQMELEGDQPEAIFIQEALTLIAERKKSLLCSSSASSLALDDATTLAPTLVNSPVETPPALDSEIANSLSGLSLSSVDALFSSDAKDLEEENCNFNVTPEDLDISNLPVYSTGNQDNKNGPKQTYYFYQASNGAHLYLHAINIKMLVKEFGSLENCPLTMKGKVMEKEMASMNNELRHRLRYLRHLPLTCNFEVVEIDLPSHFVSPNTRLEFQASLKQREKKRKQRAREERKFERKVQAEEDRMMGRSKGAKLNLQSEKHFPTFSEEPPFLTFAEDPPLVSSDFVSETEVPSLSSSISSDSPDKSLSFAQMIRDGRKSAMPAWPTTRQSVRPSNPQRMEGPAGTLDDEEDESDRVPDFNASFKADFDIGFFEQAARTAACAAQEGGANGSKKKKKKKGILLMSSGGL